jgi:TP901 family phage tail tape measure protein
MADKDKIVIKIDGDTKGFNKAVKDTSKEISKLSTTLNKAASVASSTFKASLKASAVATTALTTAVAISVKTFASFEQEMSKVKALTGATDKDFKRLEATARELGKTTKFTAKESAEAMSQLALAGRDTNQIIDTMPGLLDLAAASQLGLAESAELTTDALGLFDLEASRSSNVADLLAKTQATSKTNIRDLGEALKKSGLSAKSFGLSIEETSGILGQFAEIGFRGELAGTGLKRLLDDLRTNSKRLSEFGVSVFDAEGKLKSFNDILVNFEEVLDGANDKQKSSIIAAVGSTFAQKTLRAALTATSSKISEYTDEISRNSGEAKKMANVMLDNVSGSFTKFKSALSEVLIQIGEKFAPTIRKALDGATKFLQRSGDEIADFFTRTVKWLERTLVNFDDIIEKARGVIRVIGKIGEVLGVMGRAFDKVSSFIVDGVAGLMVKFDELRMRGSESIVDIAKRMAKARDEAASFKRAIQGIIDVFSGLSRVAAPALEATKKTFAALTDSIKGSAQEAGAGITSITEKAGAGFTKLKGFLEKRAKPKKEFLTPKEKKEKEKAEKQAEQEQIKQEKEESRIDALKKENDKRQLILDQQKETDLARQKGQNEEELALLKERQENERELLALKQEEDDILKEIDVEKNDEARALLEEKLQKHKDKIKAIEIKNIKDIAKLEEDAAKKKEERERQSAISTVKSFLSVGQQLLSIAGTKSKALFNINKGLNVAQAVTDTYAAATAALKNPPGPPSTIPMAATATAMGLANVARIAGQSYSAADGGIVPQAPGGLRDRVKMFLEPEEMVVPKKLRPLVEENLGITQEKEGETIMEHIITLGDDLREFGFRITQAQRENEIAGVSR